MRARYVYESISFQRGMDPKASMGVGLKALWEKLKEREGFRLTPETMVSQGFKPANIKIVDPEYYRDNILKFPKVFKWINYDLSKSEIEDLDSDISRSFLDKDVTKEIRKITFDIGGYLMNNNIKSLSDLKKVFPKTATFIETRPEFFVRFSSDTQWDKDLQNIFDPFSYDPDYLISVLSQCSHSLSDLLNAYPDYMEFISKNASMESKKTVVLDWSVFRDLDVTSLIESIDNEGYTPNSVSPQRYGGDDFFFSETGNLLDIISYNKAVATESLARLIDRGFRSVQKMSSNDLKKFKKLISRGFSSEIVQKYFSDLFPELTGLSKMNERDPKVLQKDYEKAEYLINNSSFAKLATSPIQRKNGSIRFNAKDGSFFTINSAGYLRKQGKAADRMAVVLYNPFSSYEELTKEGLKRAEKIK
jgi:hypothetical protein